MLKKKLTHYPASKCSVFRIPGPENLGQNGVRTRLALSNAANEAPTHNDSSSVANAKSCGVKVAQLEMANGIGNERVRTLASGMMAMKEAWVGLSALVACGTK